MDPISISLVTTAAGWAVDKLLGDHANKLVSAVTSGVIGNMADRAVCTAATSGWSYYKTLRTEDPKLNHDLERATRESYLVATSELIRHAEVRTRDAVIGWREAETLAAIQRGIRQDLRNVDDTLPTPLTDAHFFLIDPDVAPEARMQRLRETLRANLDVDLARWLPAKSSVPAAISDLLENGWTIDTALHRNVKRDWYSLIAIAFIEKLKTTPRLATVFESKLLAEIAAGDPAAEAIATFAGFTAELDKLTVPIEKIGRDVAEIKRLVEDLTGQRATQLAREQLADERERRLFQELDRRDEDLRRLRDQLGQTVAQQAASQAKLDAVIAERTQLIDTIAQRDRAYGAEVAEFRRQIESLTQAATPELQQALQRFADGDRVGAFPVIDQLIRAENHARERAAAVKSGERLRELGALALVMKDRGEKTTADVLAIWADAQQADPSHHWGWVELGRLYMEAGDLARSRSSAERALESAGSDRDRSLGFIELGNVLMARGELAAAQTRFKESLAITERLALIDPTNTEAQRDVSISMDRLGDALAATGDLAAARVHFEQSFTIRERLIQTNSASVQAQRDVSISLNKLGDVLVALGDLTAAQAHLEQSLAIDERLARANPASLEAQRNLGVSLDRLGDVLAAAGDLAGAQIRFEQSFAIAERLAHADPANAEAQRDLSVSLNKLGNVLVATGDLAAAQTRFEQSLAISERLAQANPTSAQAQRDLSISLDKLGDVLVAAGDLAAARARFEQSLAIRDRLAEANPASAEAQRDLIVIYAKLAQITEDKASWRRALAVAEQLHREGRLAPTDVWMIDRLRREVGVTARSS